VKRIIEDHPTGCTVLVIYFVIFVSWTTWNLVTAKPRPKPVNTLTQEQQVRLWTEAHNKQQREIRAALQRIETLERLQRGELPLPMEEK
jgi:hypothetical protein